MKLGFTGTRYGMTKEQLVTLKRIFELMLPIEEFHHGDCQGSDAEAHDLLRVVWNDARIIVHPGVDKNGSDEYRAHRLGDETRPEYTHFARNRHIVLDGKDWLIATPYTDHVAPQGGTSYTINYAKKMKRNLIIIWPNGTFEMETFNAGSAH